MFILRAFANRDLKSFRLAGGSTILRSILVICTSTPRSTACVGFPQPRSSAAWSLVKQLVDAQHRLAETAVADEDVVALELLVDFSLKRAWCG